MYLRSCSRAIMQQPTEPTIVNGTLGILLVQFRVYTVPWISTGSSRYRICSQHLSLCILTLSGTENPYRRKQTTHARCTNARDAQEDETGIRGHVTRTAAFFYCSVQTSCDGSGCLR